MNIGQKFLIEGNISWYCLSVFYSRDEWYNLLNSVNAFYEVNKSWIKHISIYMSNIQGERLNIVVSTPLENREEIYTLLDRYFSDFVRDQPSLTQSQRLEEESLWGNYNNNIVLWNCFQIPPFLLLEDIISEFSLYTSILILKMYEEESSYSDNILSINGFLTTKAYRLYSEINHQDFLLSKTEKYKEANHDVIEYYWRYIPNEDVNSLLSIWSNFIVKILTLYGNKVGFTFINLIICQQLGCSLIIRETIVNIINSWGRCNNLLEIELEYDLNSKLRSRFLLVVDHHADD